LLTLLICFIF